jgi:formate dehydrogenase subunit delta
VKQRDHLIHMANQIARNFATMGDVDATAATADHIAMFWDPRMKAGIFADHSGLSPVAQAAIDLLRGDPHPPHQTQATQFNAADEAGHSDAG